MASSRQHLLLGGGIAGSVFALWGLRVHFARKRRQLQAVASGPRLLVTGGAGFVLSNLVYHWLDVVPEATVVIFDQPRAWDDVAKQFFSRFLRTDQVHFFGGSVDCARSWKQLEIEHGTSFTHIVAGAALTPTEEEERSLSSRLIDVNFMGLVNCIEFARFKCKSLQRFVNISSDAVLGVPGLVNRAGTSSHGVDSDDLPEMSLYAFSKVGGEAVVARWRTLFNMDAVSVRFSDVYGPLDRDTGSRNRHNAPYWVCRLAQKKTVCGEPRKICIGGSSVDDFGWDYIDAQSVARGLVAILQLPSRPKRRTYHLALGRCVSHRELLEACGCTPDDVELVQTGQHDAAVTGNVDIVSLGADHWLRKSPMDVASMRSEFGFEASSVQQAVKEYMEWLRTHDY